MRPRVFMAASTVVVAFIGGGYAATVARGSSPSASSTGASGAAVTTAEVVRANLSSTTQVGGSLGYNGSYTVINPAGTSAQNLTQAQQAVTQAQQALSADQVTQGDDTTASNQAVSSAETAVSSAQSTLNTDRDSQIADCAGAGSATPACTKDAQVVTQDQTQLTQAESAEGSAELAATRSAHQDQAKLTGDTTALDNAQAALTADQQNATIGGATFTALPAAGAEVAEGQTLYDIDNQAVALLYGKVPAWRDFRAGMTDGSDVGELTADLIALGFGAGLIPGDHFSSATAAALSRWQTSLGQPPTGVLLLGAAVFEPGPIRVTSVTPTLGQAANPGPVLHATGTTPVVSVALPVTQEYEVRAGDAVTVVLPDGTTTVPGHILTVASVATAAANSSSPPTVAVTVSLEDPKSAGAFDEAPVNVNITTQSAPNVLAVPINALLALEEGGDAVEVVSGSSHHLVAVQTGLFSNTMVQINGPGISAGMHVEVPAQ